MVKIKSLLIKYKSFLMYAVFGVLTTVVNIVSYYLCYNSIRIPNILSTIIAWILAVLFAFITNKLWVFDSKSFDLKILRHELLTFFGCRLATGILDVAIMYVAVDLLSWNSVIWKLISNILVIVINYIASKLLIFNRKEKDCEN